MKRNSSFNKIFLLLSWEKCVPYCGIDIRHVQVEKKFCHDIDQV